MEQNLLVNCSVGNQLTSLWPWWPADHSDSDLSMVLKLSHRLHLTLWWLKYKVQIILKWKLVMYNSNVHNNLSIYHFLHFYISDIIEVIVNGLTVLQSSLDQRFSLFLQPYFSCRLGLNIKSVSHIYLKCARDLWPYCFSQRQLKNCRPWENI